MKCGMYYSLRESSAAWKTKKRHTYAWFIAIILISLRAEPHKTYIEIASAGNCRNNYSKKKNQFDYKRDSNLPKNLRYATPTRRCCTLDLQTIHGEAVALALYLRTVSVPLQIIVSDILSIQIGFFHSRKSNTINVDKHKDQHDLQQITDGFYPFFTILSWYSKVRDSESLLFQLAVNRD